MIAGYTGILTGIRPGAYMVSINERENHGSLLSNLYSILFDRSSFEDA